MIGRLKQVLILALVMAGIAASSYAADDNAADDNFLTNTINSIFDKVGKVTSGEEGILIKDYNKSDAKAPDYATDALGRKIQEPTIRSTGALSASKDEKGTSAADKKTE
jgi:hypothetical protein